MGGGILPATPSLRRTLRASTSFVLALRAAGADTSTLRSEGLHVDPAAAPALTGTYPGGGTRARPAVKTLETVKHHLEPNRQR
jgi:hypothetical protein